VERLCFLFEIRPGTEAEYKRRHDDIWPEMRDALKAAGLRNYTIFRRGAQMIAYVEAPDVEAALAEMGASDVNRRWSEWFEDVVVGLVDERGELQRAEQVWHLD